MEVENKFWKMKVGLNLLWYHEENERVIDFIIFIQYMVCIYTDYKSSIRGKG